MSLGKTIVRKLNLWERRKEDETPSWVKKASLKKRGTIITARMGPWEKMHYGKKHIVGKTFVYRVKTETQEIIGGQGGGGSYRAKYYRKRRKKT